MRGTLEKNISALDTMKSEVKTVSSTTYSHIFRYQTPLKQNRILRTLKLMLILISLERIFESISFSGPHYDF